MDILRRLVAVIITAIMLAGITACYKQEALFKADEQLQAQADAILDDVAENDHRIEGYLELRGELAKYNGSSARLRKQIQQTLDNAKKKYTGLDQTLDIGKDGAAAVDAALFEYLVVRAFYAQRELDEVLLENEDVLKGLILNQGYTIVTEWKNTTYQIGTKYYYGTMTAYDEFNCYSINTLQDGQVEYMSVPVTYSMVLTGYLDSYLNMTAAQRATEFASRLTEFTASADIMNNQVLALIYDENELSALDSFLKGLTLDYIDSHSITKEQEAYTNKQLLIELGNTRFILRITVYGLFMDVIQHKDYYNGSFMTDLAIVRNAYLGQATDNVDSSRYIVITP